MFWEWFQRRDIDGNPDGEQDPKSFDPPTRYTAVLCQCNVLYNQVRLVQEAVEAQAKPIIQKNMEYPGDERILALNFNPIVPIHI